MSIFKKINNFLNKRYMKINFNELSLISGSLAQLYKDGIKINEALNLIKEIILTKEYKRSIDQIVKNIESGETLSAAFYKHYELYPKFFIGIISIGENSGNLYEALNALKEYYGKRAFIKKYILSSLAYPIILFISILALIVFLVLIVIPNFNSIYSSIGIKAPIISQKIYEISMYIKENISISIMFLLCWGVIIPFIIIKKLMGKKYMYLLSKFKIFNRFLEYVIVFIISIIINSGMNISYGLKQCASSMNSGYISNKLIEINKDILKGNTLSESIINADIFSKYTIAIIKVREESGSVGEGLKELSIILEKSLIKIVNKYLSLLQPFFIIVISVIITLFFIIFILPLFDGLKVGIIK
ncbi:type II secretion system F family protein [Clostridium taeniosporum]|uniref:Type II secretion protein F n=1 Tax=Clostridium taeniosporum TaxID=394958 RepID=A0A1D7XKR5_9CLOT|nr:type II secretion system F family protein [Clostridium taeniosporum]AOR23926.1 type II secretion protein F [Clostridium taeniosporum]